jgi:hypothetical protein
VASRAPHPLGPGEPNARSGYGAIAVSQCRGPLGWIMRRSVVFLTLSGVACSSRGVAVQPSGASVGSAETSGEGEGSSLTDATTGSPDPSSPTDGGTEGSTVDPMHDSSGGGTEGSSAGSSSTGTPPESTSTGVIDESTSQGETLDPLFDVGLPQDCPEEPLSGFFWVPSGSDNTISKIDVVSLVELGRYRTAPDDNLAVAVSVDRRGAAAMVNGQGGVTKIHGNLEDCDNPDNTSSGPGDVRAWPDGCVAWHTPTSYGNQQVVAWTSGEVDPDTCVRSGAKLWVSGVEAGIEVALLDGESGAIEQVVPLPDVPVGDFGFGLFAGAVDGDGDLWASQLNVGSLVEVRLADLEYDFWPMPHVGYGMTVDGQGRVWTCNEYASRFDPTDETWESEIVADYAGAGCMVDAAGTLWIAGTHVTGVDTETFEVTSAFPVPPGPNPENRVLSVDGAGYVWSASHWHNEAYRWDPATGEHDTVTGLDFPIAWSDLTGFALAHAG